MLLENDKYKTDCEINFQTIPSNTDTQVGKYNEMCHRFI